MATIIPDRTKPLALKDWAYEILKEDILSFKLMPGTMVRIQNLSEELNISRTPIREALLALEKEGLVHAESRVGFFITQVTRRDLIELYELRAVLEGYAVETATVLITDQDIARLEAEIENCRNAVAHGKLEQFLVADTSFHALIIERAPNSRLMVMMENFRDFTHRIHYLGLDCIEDIHLSLEEHQRILSAMRLRDADLAGSLMREHLNAVMTRLLQCVNLGD